MSYYNQPLYGLGKAKAIQNGDQYKNGTNQYKNGASQWKIGANIKMVQANIKMVQAIFLPGAWGKIPVFMGKNHPTPGAAMAFCMLKTTPLKSVF